MSEDDNPLFRYIMGEISLDEVVEWCKDNGISRVEIGGVTFQTFESDEPLGLGPHWMN